ncbi:MAG: S8 family serine peptidase, partial [Gammaproteobacteria bacterium]
AFVPDQVVVAFKPGTPGEAKRAAHAQAGGRVINTHAAINAVLVGIPSGTLLNKIAVYKHNPNVRYAEPNYYRTLSSPSEGYDPFVCSDYYWDEQWGLHTTGQSLLDPSTGECTITGRVDADIDWLEVWDSGVRGRSTIKIAIVDTGIESTHPDLESKIVEAWATTDISISEGPGDLIGHGTHVAGIAAAATNNGIGISGVGINTMVGSLKACQCYPGPGLLCFTGICEDWDTVEAISYATAEGYHVINMSFGGPYVSSAVEDAVNQALGAGLVLVSSAGNEYSFDEPSYPAAFEGVIAVAATDHYDNLASFSNFGNWVEVAAPGVNILSTYPGAGCGNIADCYNWMSGTSMASPIVAGTAALVFDSIGGPDPIVRSIFLRNAVINAILNNADHTGALGQNMLAWTQYGRLNLQAALTGGGSNIPPSVQITLPLAGSPFYEGDNIIIEANATDSDGTISQVEFFQGAESLGIDDTGNPYQVTWNNVLAGSYSLTAVATDDSGATTTSDVVLITVNTTGGDCTALAWDDATSYSKRDIVSHNNHEWKAKNTSTNVEPGTSKRHWADLGPCN